MAEIIKLEKLLRKKYELETLDVIKEALGIALQHYTLEDEHHKAAKIMETLNKWDEFFKKGNNEGQNTI